MEAIHARRGTVDGVYGGKKDGKQLFRFAHRLEDAAGYLPL